jgi:hypothetical protein
MEILFDENNEITIISNDPLIKEDILKIIKALLTIKTID